MFTFPCVLKSPVDPPLGEKSWRAKCRGNAILAQIDARDSGIGGAGQRDKLSRVWATCSRSAPHLPRSPRSPSHPQRSGRRPRGAAAPHAGRLRSWPSEPDQLRISPPTRRSRSAATSTLDADRRRSRRPGKRAAPLTPTIAQPLHTQAGLQPWPSERSRSAPDIPTHTQIPQRSHLHARLLIGAAAVDMVREQLLSPRRSRSRSTRSRTSTWPGERSRSAPDLDNHTQIPQRSHLHARRRSAPRGRRPGERAAPGAFLIEKSPLQCIFRGQARMR